MLLSSLAATYVLVHLLSADRLSLIFKARLKLIALTLTSMRGKKTPALRFLCRNWFLFEIYEAFDIEFEKSIW